MATQKSDTPPTISELSRLVVPAIVIRPVAHATRNVVARIAGFAETHRVPGTKSLDHEATPLRNGLPISISFDPAVLR